VIQATYLSTRVDEIMTRAAADCGALLLRNVLLDLRVSTTFCRYLWIDRFGVLATDVQDWPGSRIAGTQTGRDWTAKTKQGRPVKFGNPITAAETRHGVLVDALLATGRRLEPEYIQDLIVFAGADTSALRLNQLARGRCIDHTELDAYLRGRSDFPPNHGILQRHEVADLESFFRAVDRSSDDKAVESHSTAASPRFRNPFARRESIQVEVSDSLAGIAPVASRLSDRYPSEVARQPRGQTRSALPVLLLVLLVVLSYWLFALDGLYVVRSKVDPLLARLQVGQGLDYPSASAPIASGSTVSSAVRVLQESAPDVAATAVNLNSPTVSTNGDTTAYTWVYQKPGATPAPHTMTLTFDSTGALRGVTGY